VSGPLPPSDLASRVPELVTLPAGTVVHRFYTAEYDPIFFDLSLLGRLNAPDGSYGVLYVAEKPSGAFAETFLRTPGRTLIDADLLGRKAHVRLETRSDLTLIKLAGPGLAILGATAEVVHGGLPYDVPQAWSKALFEHPISAHGIAYYARHDDEALCYAIFERARSAIKEVKREIDLDKSWFWQLAQRYKVGMAPN
jgi:RES domain